MPKDRLKDVKQFDTIFHPLFGDCIVTQIQEGDCFPIRGIKSDSIMMSYNIPDACTDTGRLDEAETHPSFFVDWNDCRNYWDNVKTLERISQAVSEL